MRNIYNLKHFVTKFRPDFIFLTEPQLHSCDIDLVMQYFKNDFLSSLNSADKYDPDIPLTSSRAKGGTMVLWRYELDAYVTVYPVKTTSILPLIFTPPGFQGSIHICIYLPTCGQDRLFMEEFTSLSSLIKELVHLYPGLPVYIRGDFNASRKNVVRSNIFEAFKYSEELDEVNIDHTTYHHFTGNGGSDSELDRILYSRCVRKPELLIELVCKLTNPLVDSHHDILISSWSTQEEILPCIESNQLIAPKISKSRHKICWTDSGVEAYQNMILPHLKRLQDSWLHPETHDPLSINCNSMLLDSTNYLLSECAKACNKVISLPPIPHTKESCTPSHIKKSSRKLLKMWKLLRQIKLYNTSDSEIVQKKLEAYKQAKLNHRKLLRNHRYRITAARDSQLLRNPKATYAAIRRKKNAAVSKINILKVGSKTYHGERVGDGFYDSILTIKLRDENKLQKSPHYNLIKDEYKHILDLCRESEPITEAEALSLLQRLKPSVSDYFSVTPSHYIYAGPLGVRHFCLLFNTFLHETSNLTIKEVNRAYACILFKGHDKDKMSARSYRTISTCPVVAKAMDLYIRDKNISSWNAYQAPTQFQGEGSSHELAALLLTECLQHSLYSLHLPAFVLYLDAKSAFDVVQKELLIRNLYHAQKADQSINYIDLRMSNRETVVDWNGQLMGPISDEQGLEQGGISSSDLYKIYGREQLMLAQNSGLGIMLGELTVSAIGQADDTVLVSNDINDLFYLSKLSEISCAKSFVDLCSEKIKLQVFVPNSVSRKSIEEGYNPIKINDVPIQFTTAAEHVGILRSTSGNCASLLSRFAAHRRALAGVLHTGLALSHHGNPASSIKIEKLYATPVLLSGIGSLVLSNKEISLIESHYCETLRKLLRIHEKTPRSVIYFLAGSLPGTALVHLRQLSLFGMISRLEGNILNQHAKNIYDRKTISPKSWFHQIRDLCLLYSLEHPSKFLANPAEKKHFKMLIKKKIVTYWETKLREEATSLVSLTYFKPCFMSLLDSHPIIVSAGLSASKVAMATVQMKMLSGRYRTNSLMSHWSKNRSGCCSLSPECIEIKEDIPHILQFCPALSDLRLRMYDYVNSFCEASALPDEVKRVLLEFCHTRCPLFCDFLLDCSSIPEVIHLSQRYGKGVLHSCFEVTRTYVYALHRQRLKFLGTWKQSSN